jgi:hypothetical protein
MSLMYRATAVCLAAVCFLSAGSAARADHITYQFETSYPSISLDHGLEGIRVTGSGTLPTSGTIDAKLSAFSFTFPGTHESIPIDLKLTDSQTHQSKTVVVGTLTETMTSHGLKLDFHSAGSKTATFGTNTYTISFLSDSFHSEGRFLSQGQLKFSVSDPTPAAHTPEPSSLLLAAIGVPLFGVFLRRRRA